MTDPTTPAADASGILERAKMRTSSGRIRQGGEEFLFGIRDEVAELLTGSPFDVDSYLQNAYRELLKSNLLIQAAKDSGPTVLGGIMLGATLQLPIGGPLGQFYLTPRNEGRGESKRAVCVPMIGYRGFFELGYRSGRIRAFDYVIRRQGDTWKSGASAERGKWFDLEQFAEGEFDENDENGVKRELTGVVALAHPLASDRPAWQFMSKATIDRRKPKYTDRTPWEGEHREAMYVKTPHRELAKFLQLSIATAQAAEFDERISEWNRQTQALRALDSTEGQVYEEGAVVDEAGNGPDAPPAEPSAPISDPATVSPSEAPEPAQGDFSGSSSANVDALDLPAHVRRENREMTAEEFERYSAAGGE